VLKAFQTKLIPVHKYLLPFHICPQPTKIRTRTI